MMENALPKEHIMQVFRPAGGVFKLVPPLRDDSSRFKPASPAEVTIVPPQQPTPTEFGHLGISAKASAAAPPLPPVPPVATGAPSPEDDEAKIMARMQKLLKSEHRTKDLEEENRVLVRTIARLQAENDALKAKG